jgi:hypothetical protein
MTNTEWPEAKPETIEELKEFLPSLFRAFESAVERGVPSRLVEWYTNISVRVFVLTDLYAMHPMKDNRITDKNGPSARIVLWAMISDRCCLARKAGLFAASVITHRSLIIQSSNFSVRSATN